MSEQGRIVVSQYGVMCGFCDATISMNPEDWRNIVIIHDLDDVIAIDQVSRRVMHRCSTMYVIEELTL